MKLLRLFLLPWLLAAAFSPAQPAPAPRPLPPASWDKLPLWHGFNLLEKFNVGKNERFREEDFRLISELGFNFVRIPMDYRIWIKDGDWTALNEAALAEIDECVELGRKYGIHVALNFHRAPGYTVAKPPEPRDLWTDPEAQRVCAMHWAAFARRYKGIPNDRLSFNLFNEPAHITPEQHAAVVKIVTDAIRKEDPNRLVICDAREWGNIPCEELVPLKVAQATRGYQPMGITHYKASWTGGLGLPEPWWPLPKLSGYLHNPRSAGKQSAIVIECLTPAAGTLRLHVSEVFNSAHLLVKADGQPILSQPFATGPQGKGDWKKSQYHEQWKSYQCLYDRDYQAQLPPGTKRIEIGNTNGTWISLASLAIESQPDTQPRRVSLPLEANWDAPPLPPAHFDPANRAQPFSNIPCTDGETLWQKQVLPFVQLRDAGTGVVVGEFGSYNKTPHDVALRWMEDCLKNWKRARFGWAMWNFRGPFGVLDSERADVAYEDFQGHKLDRKMLDLLLQYSRP